MTLPSYNKTINVIWKYDFMCLHSCRNEEKRNSHENICKSNKFCENVMLNVENKILK